MAATSHTETLSGWGRRGVPGRELLGEDLERLTREAVLSRGMGRSYGDSSLPPPGGTVAATRLADRILGFDPATGLLRAEAGLQLREINRIFWRRGFSSPILPGTQLITLGGMAASDVHDKSHHRNGTFGRHVESLRLRLASGEVVDSSRSERPDLFRATLGGMGLVGHILEVELRLQKIPSPWVWAETERIGDLDVFLAGLARAAESWPMTMGWIDCLTRGKHMGRGILYCGRWAEPSEAPSHLPRPKTRLAVPVDFPGWALNPLSMRIFNFGYYWKQMPRRKRGILHPESFFHPLDAIRDWNRIYGKRGFTQHQAVIPKAAGPQAVRRFLELLTSLKAASFLCVIKDCGEEGEGLLSFPMPGTSIALDIPARPGTPEVVAKLNECVIAAGGRVYLTKDTFTTAEHFRAMEPRLDAFLEVKRRYDPRGKIRSAQAERLFGDLL